MRRVISIILSIVILTGLLVSCADNTPNSKSETKSKKTAVKELNESQIKALAEKYDKRLERSDFEGVCYVTERGRTIYNKGVNYADKKKKIKNSENTVFRIASITKQFTAAAIMILQERGKLSVNDKLNKYLPDYKYGGKITLANLLQMRSGIPEYISEDMYSTLLNEKALFKNTAEQNKKNFEKRILSEKLRFDPDSRFEYSNSNYYLLGEIVEKASGTSYHKFIKKEIFDKLGMTSSGFVDDANKFGDNVAKPYNAVDENLKILKIKAIAFACGDIMTNAVDLVKWADGLRNNKILSEQSLKAMTRAKSNYGYGLNVMKSGNAVYHSGGFPPYYSMLFTALDSTEYTCIVLSNYNCTLTGDVTAKFGQDYLDVLTR